jgi:hypothetical protein
MKVDGDMITQLGLKVYSAKLESRLTTAWIRYDLPTETYLFKFMLPKTNKARLPEAGLSIKQERKTT